MIVEARKLNVNRNTGETILHKAARLGYHVSITCTTLALFELRLSLLHSVNIFPDCEANTALSSNVGYPSFLGRKRFIIIFIKVSIPTLKTMLVGRHYTRLAPEVGLVSSRS